MVLEKEDVVDIICVKKVINAYFITLSGILYRLLLLIINDFCNENS